MGKIDLICLKNKSNPKIVKRDNKKGFKNLCMIIFYKLIFDAGKQTSLLQDNQSLYQKICIL